MINIFLIPIKWLFYIIVGIKNFCYNIPLCKIYTFDIPIISIGNIAFGGTGKTPMVIHLGEKLKVNGYKPAVISRGYKRQSSGLVVVNDGNNTLSNVNNTGDEPYLISKRLGDVPVVVCKKREQAVDYIINTFSDVNVILLDDGFQYRRLNRNVDIVLLNGGECSDILRESKSSLKRADIILTLDKQYSITEFQNDTFTPKDPHTGVYAFCGIANSESFLSFIKSKNIDIKGQSVLKDHHEYSNQSMKTLENSINQSGADSIITTEKDLVKLSVDFLKSYKVYIVMVNIHFEDDTYYNKIIKGIAKL